MLSAQVQARVDELILALIPQVRAEAWRVFQKAPHALERDELEGIGNYALSWAAAHWEDYCGRKGYDPARTEFVQAYALRRIRGALMDHLRSKDWVPRAVRTRHKALEEAGAAAGTPLEELEARTGYTAAQIRSTQAEVARRPVSLDDSACEIIETSGVEANAVLSSVLEAVAAVRRELSPEVQAVLALRYYEHRDLPACAEALGLDELAVRRLHDEGVLAVHQAMLGAVA